MTVSNRFLLLAAFLLARTILPAQELHTLTGSVTDAVSGEQLAAANIRLIGTSRGTIANASGKFILRLSPGRQTVVISMLGYRPDTLGLDLHADRSVSVSLARADITLPEVVITAEDPAMAIMRKVIANKHVWSDKLVSYEFEAFNRQVLRRDTSIAGITETFTRGVWQIGDTLREVITRKRQTENVPAANNFTSVGRILNFYDDEIRFVGYSFTGPTAPDAFDDYSFKLLRTARAGGRDIHVIAMLPKTRTAPLFSGTLSVAGDSYALAGIDVEPNDAFQIPFVKERSLRYRQQFALYDSVFWMPVDIRIEAEFKVGVMGLTIPKFGLQQTSVVTKYTINLVIPDSLLHSPRLRTDSLASRPDSAFWASNAVVPLNPSEQIAYAKLDSTQTMEKQFKPTGALGALNDLGGSSESFLSMIDVSFNRVEGAHLGGHGTFDSVAAQTSFRLGAAYGFSDKYWSYRFGATVFTSADRRLGIGADAYRIIDHTEDRGYYAPLSNSFSALLDKNDYRDYFANRGWRGFVAVKPGKDIRLQGSFVSEHQNSAQQTTDFSLLARSGSYRPNPAITEGDLRSFRVDLRLGGEEIPLGLIAQNSFTAALEHSSAGMLGSDFDFTRYEGAAEYSVATFGKGFFLKPTLRLRMAAGGSLGTLPAQRTFWLETASSSFAPFGVMKALPVKELGGSAYWSVNLEHNFRTIPFLALGISSLYESAVEVLVHGGAARVWNGTASPDEPVYAEAGFGFSRIFDIIRADFSWRLSGPGGFRFTLGVATLL